MCFRKRLVNNSGRKKEQDEGRRRRGSQTDFRDSGRALGNPRKGEDKCLGRGELSSSFALALRCFVTLKIVWFHLPRDESQRREGMCGFSPTPNHFFKQILTFGYKARAATRIINTDFRFQISQCREITNPIIFFIFHGHLAGFGQRLRTI